MKVRCGRCRAEFDVPGPGLHVCPVCGSRNDVRTAGADPAAGASPPVPAAPETPSPRIECGGCGLSFIVGAVAEAPCPNCGEMGTVAAAEGGG